MDTNNKIEFIKTTTAKLKNGDVQAAYPEEYPYSFIHTQDVYDNGGKDEQLYIGEERITDRLNVGDTVLSSPTRKVGGLEAATVAALSTKSISQIILEMVRPDVVIPKKVVDASISISYPGERLIKVGTSLPVLTDISYNITSGEWSDGTPYAGDPFLPSIGMTTVHACTANVDWGTPAWGGSYAISGWVAFGEGGIPKDNFGKEYPELQFPNEDDPEPERYSETIYITAVNPVYINGYETRDGDDYDPITHSREHLVNYYSENPSIEITIPAETYSERMRIYVPGNCPEIEVYKYDPTRSDLGDTNPKNWNIIYNTKETVMKCVGIGDTYDEHPGYYEYVRDPEVDNSYNTAPTLYKINLKL